MLSQCHLKLLSEKLQRRYELNIQFNIDLKSEWKVWVELVSSLKNLLLERTVYLM